MSAKTKTTKTTKVSTKSKEVEAPVTKSNGTMRVIKPFFDLEAKRNRLVGDEFVCDGERAKRLAKNGFVEVI